MWPGTFDALRLFVTEVGRMTKGLAFETLSQRTGVFIFFPSDNTRRSYESGALCECLCQVRKVITNTEYLIMTGCVTLYSLVS